MQGQKEYIAGQGPAVAAEITQALLGNAEETKGDSPNQ